MLKETFHKMDEKLLFPLSLQNQELLLSQTLATKPMNVFYSWQY